MDFVKFRIKFEEPFKDGNILEGRFFKIGEVVDVSESDCKKIQQSGGYITILQSVIPNPKKVEEVKEQVEDKPVEALPEKRKAGRPRVNKV